MSTINPELQNKIANWRARAATGELTLEEMREAIKLLRGSRIAASQSASAKAKKPPSRTVDDLLGDLESM